MKKIILGLLLALLITSCNNVNRYELFSNTNSGPTLLVDKNNGTVWQLNRNGLHKKPDTWTNIGTPPKEAPEKGDKCEACEY